MSAFNAFVIHCELYPDWNRRTCRRRLFLKELGEALSAEYRDSRGNQHPTVQLAMNRYQGGQMEGEQRATGRCGMCERRKDRKVKQRCSNCNVHICNEHSKIVCNNCLE